MSLTRPCECVMNQQDPSLATMMHTILRHEVMLQQRALSNNILAPSSPLESGGLHYDCLCRHELAHVRKSVSQFFRNSVSRPELPLPPRYLPPLLSLLLGSSYSAASFSLCSISATLFVESCSQPRHLLFLLLPLQPSVPI